MPLDASLLCLVGENGSGKSNVLEMIASVASSFGLTPGVALKRGGPLGEPHWVSAVLALPADADIVLPDHPASAAAVAEWDRTLHMFSANPPDPGHMTGVFAGGVTDVGMRQQLAQQVVQQLQMRPEVNHLYLDAERSFPQFSVQDHELIGLMRQDMRLPTYLRQQASVLTQNMYSEWMRSMLAGRLRAQSEYWLCHEC